MSKKTIIFLIIAVLCVIAAIVFFIGPMKYLGGMWIAIGACNLMAAIEEMKKSKE